MEQNRDERESAAAGISSRISSEDERRRLDAIIKDYDRRKATVRRVLEDVLATECASQDGPLTEMLSEGYREQTGKTVEIAMVSDFLSEISDQLSLPKNPKKKPPPPKKPKRVRKQGPRPKVVVGPDGEERAVPDGWAGAFRAIAQEIATGYPGQEDIWGSLPFIMPKHLLPDYVKDIAANVEVVPGLWLNTHGSAEAVQRNMHMMLEAFGYPPHQWRLRFNDGTWLKL